MPVTGRKPKPDGAKRNRHKPVHDWLEVPDVPFAGRRLPQRRPDGETWPAGTRKWWQAISTMPHCCLWSDGDWQFALDTAFVASRFHVDGDLRAAGELRARERLLGSTIDSRRDLRIRYVDPGGDGEV